MGEIRTGRITFQSGTKNRSCAEKRGKIMTTRDERNGPPNSIASRDLAYHLHPYTNLKTLPREGPNIITRGKGVRVYDEDGKAYIEGMAGLWCTALGFGEERLADTAARAMRELSFYHGFNGHASPPVIDLSERLIAMAPVPMSKVLFSNSGSEANDTAVKLAWYYNNAVGRPEKKKIISRIKAYHGCTIVAASLTGLPNNQTNFDLPVAGILHTTFPHHYRSGDLHESEEDFATRCAQDLDDMIEREGPHTVAAFIAEPVMGAGGVIIPPATYFEKIQAVLRKHDVLFIVDEVICGFGRTGNTWGCQTYDLKPDMITMAKGLSSAYIPISALMVTDAIYDAMVEASGQIGVFGHGFTYSGHPVAASVALEVLDIFEEREVFRHVRQRGPYMLDGLRYFAGHPLVGEVRGVGLMAAVELVRNKETREPFDAASGVGTYLAKRAREHGLIVRAMGDSIAFSPPLIISREDIDEMLASFGRALDETEMWTSQGGLV
jgi:4-aminobutyrate---pyruvate transaminase